MPFPANFDTAPIRASDLPQRAPGVSHALVRTSRNRRTPSSRTYGGAIHLTPPHVGVTPTRARRLVPSSASLRRVTRGNDRLPRRASARRLGARIVAISPLIRTHARCGRDRLHERRVARRRHTSTRCASAARASRRTGVVRRARHPRNDVVDRTRVRLHVTF